MSSEFPAHAAYIWSRTSLLQQIRQLLHATSDWPGVEIRWNRCGLQFVAGDETLGSLEWDGRLAVPFPTGLSERLIAEAMATRDPDDSGEGGVVWTVRSPADVDRAVWLLRLAFLLSTKDQEEQLFPDDL
jgi:hypothetical protein